MVFLKGRALLAVVTTITSTGFLLIGFDNGLMGGLVNGPAFNDFFDYPSATMIGLIVAIYEVGCFLGAIITAFIGEGLGRRKTIGIGAIIMIIGAVLQCSSFSRAQLVVARVVSGVGMGFINSTVPVLQAEYSPKLSRGLLVCLQLTTLNFGIMLVYWIDFALSPILGSLAWRIPMILQCIFLLPMIGLLFIVPETPRWLAGHDMPDESLAVLKRLKAGTMDEAEIELLHQEIVRTVSIEVSVGAGSWKDLLRNDVIQSRRRLLISCAIQIFQQLGGNNAIIYYSGTLFQESIGFDSHMSSLMSGYLQTWFFVASFIPWLLIDRVGRRPLLLSMISLMAAVMAVQAGLIYQVQFATSIKHAAGIGASTMLFIFLGAFTVGFQATVWVYPSEILPLRLRQRGSSISTASNWIFNYLVVQITPPAINNIGWKTYIIFAVFNAVWVPIVYFYFPETKGMELEEVDMMFSKEDDLAAAAFVDKEKEVAEIQHIDGTKDV